MSPAIDTTGIEKTMIETLHNHWSVLFLSLISSTYNGSTAVSRIFRLSYCSGVRNLSVLNIYLKKEQYDNEADLKH